MPAAVSNGSSAFEVTFDTGHDASDHFSQRPVIDKHIDRLSHMHLHDTLVSAHRDHMTFGEGELELSSYLELADKHGCRVVVEVKTIEGLRRSVEWLKRIH